MKTILVRAGKNGPCATESNPRRFINDEPTEVDESSYYVRRIADGDLVLVELPPAAAAVLEQPAEEAPAKTRKGGK